MQTTFPLPKVPIIRNRHEFVLERCKDKSILHLGCVDTGLLETRFRQGQLLHQKLAAITNDLWGIDINAEGIDFLRNQGFSNLLIGDVSELAGLSALSHLRFDIIVASEIIEHLPNPGLFLSNIQTLMEPEKTDLIITVPNAFRIHTLLGMLKGVEYIHPDHNYWFSYYTITNLVQKHGFTITECCVYSSQQTNILPQKLIKRLSKKEKIAVPVQGLTAPVIRKPWQKGVNYLQSLRKRMLAAFLYHKTSFFSDGIIIVAKLKDNV